jgi:hypothetical protein
LLKAFSKDLDTLISYNLPKWLLTQEALIL